MNRDATILPSLLGADHQRLGDEIRMATQAGTLVFHLDAMDGSFVQAVEFEDDKLFAAIRDIAEANGRVETDVHIMVSDPEETARRLLARSSRDSLPIDRLTFHVEAIGQTNGLRLARTLSDEGIAAGVAIKPGTSLEELSVYLPHVGHVLIMTVEPGAGGQAIIPNAVQRIGQVQTMIQSSSICTKPIIQIDGGVKLDNIGSLARAGAQEIVVGSGFFNADDYAERLQALKRAANGR